MSTAPLTILVLGGYGVFGTRLCELLAPDARLSLLVAGRSLQRASAWCAALPPGAQRQPLAFDRDGDAGALLARYRPDLLIDASGPFQSYGAAPYRLVEACLEHGVNYLDFADGSDFVAGIAGYDVQARQRGLFMLSGVSSFPVLTAAVVRHLARDMGTVSAIEGGIAPSPFAGFGLNVIGAIAAYAGQPVALVRDGRPALAHALTESRRYTISPPGRMPLASRHFSLVDVPDLQMLPPLWPGLDRIWMGAGPVPEILHRMLNGLAWLVRLRLLPSLAPCTPLLHRAVNLLRWGEHRSGMVVEVHGTDRDGAAITRAWHMLAEGDDGPYIPCMALQAAVQRTLDGKPPAPGARAATGELELDDYARLFAPRAIHTGEREVTAATSAATLFQRLLGSAWAGLPAPVRALHQAQATLKLTGKAEVRRGTGWLARAIAGAVGFPAAGGDVPVSVTVQRHRQRDVPGETWTRTFAGRSFSSTLTLGVGRSVYLLCERFGPFTFDIALLASAGKLQFVIRDWRIGRLRLPRRWAPGGDSYEYADGERFCFAIEIRHPLAGLVVSYTGSLVPLPEPETDE